MDGTQAPVNYKIGYILLNCRTNWFVIDVSYKRSTAEANSQKV